MGRRATLGLMALIGGLLGSLPLAAQEAERPLSAIDWLGAQSPVAAPPPAKIVEPPVTRGASAPQVQTQPLEQAAAREIGLVPAAVTGLSPNIWRGSELKTLTGLIKTAPDYRLRAAQDLFFSLLLAEAAALGGDPRQGDRLALARVRALMKRGAVEPAAALIEQAGSAQSPAHFALAFDLALLRGTEDRACSMLRAQPHLSRAYDVMIFCAARAGAWENAALTFGSAQALGLLPDDQLALLDLFLNPELAEETGAPPPPRKPSPLTFRLYEALGEPLPTRRLPLPFAVADLRDLAGWKAQLEAGERLARAGSLSANRLLGLYTDRRAAASGGVWERVRALQNLDTALDAASLEAITKTLPSAWEAFKEAGLAPVLAELFAAKLMEVRLTGKAERARADLILLSENSEAFAARVEDTSIRSRIAQGLRPTTHLSTMTEAAVAFGFDLELADKEILALSRQEALGEAILRALSLLHEGQNGDLQALTRALATLRAMGLEQTARDAALELLTLGETP